MDESIQFGVVIVEICAESLGYPLGDRVERFPDEARNDRQIKGYRVSAFEQVQQNPHLCSCQRSI
jgi:hypothetical protein